MQVVKKESESFLMLSEQRTHLTSDLSQVAKPTHEDEYHFSPQV